MEAAPAAVSLRVQGTTTPVQFNREALSQARSKLTEDSLPTIDVASTEGPDKLYTFTAANFSDEALLAAIADTAAAVDPTSLPEVTP